MRLFSFICLFRWEEQDVVLVAQENTENVLGYLKCLSLSWKIQLSLINFYNKWATPSGKTCIITKIKRVDKVLGWFPVQSRALGTNSMTEIEGLKGNDDFQFCAATKDVCPQHTEVCIKQPFIRKIYSHLKKVLSFCLLARHGSISSEHKTLCSFVWFFCLMALSPVMMYYLYWGHSVLSDEWALPQ